MFVWCYFNNLKYKIKAVCKALDETNTILGCWRCFLYSEFIPQKDIDTLEREILNSISHFSRYRKHYLCNALPCYHCQRKIQCYIHWMAVVKTRVIKCGSPLRHYGTCARYFIWSLCSSQSHLLFIHIQHVINLKKLGYIIPCFLPISVGFILLRNYCRK